LGIPGLPFSSDVDIIVHGKRQKSEILGLLTLDVYTVEKMRERHGSGRLKTVPLEADGGGKTPRPGFA
jgi:hypothetical protein